MIVLTGERSVSALAAAHDMGFAAVREHVAVLGRAGPLTKRRGGREQLARGDLDAVRSMASMLADLPGDGHRPRPRPRPRPRRPGDLLHDRPGGRQARRVLAGRRGRRAAELRVRRRLRRARLHPQARTAGEPERLHVHGARCGTRAVYESRYASAEALQQVLDMGVVEGASLSIGQIDGLLAG